MIDVLTSAADHQSESWQHTVLSFHTHEPLPSPTRTNQWLHTFRQRVLQPASTQRLWTHYAKANMYLHWPEVAEETISDFRRVICDYENQLQKYIQDHPQGWTLPNHWLDTWKFLLDIRKARGTLSIDNTDLPHAGLLLVEISSLGASSKPPPPDADSH